ncbi:OmpH family outer membrane protein [Salipiger aestuarii]|uniref:OmpH family outer membrane protein n=1 Tax=Salipiger aestuarii TaxID=568098 RepID=UPI00123A7C74|nr:OmpH family outer membrane protein [Salipiger aestuarii]KAA8608160.1 outer membrane chaperone Skp [Salipiger aestuarii]
MRTALLCAGLALGIAGQTPSARAQSPTGQDGPDRAQPGAARSVQQPQGVVRSALLTIEIDRLFAESAYGARVAAMIEDEGTQIAAENRRIEAELTEEERALTEQRAALEPARFRSLADAFDQKVQALRQEQDAKARALGTLSEESRRQFLQLAEPVLGEIMQQAGAAVLLDKRTVFLSADVIDITDVAISRIDEAIGDGAGTALPQPSAVPAGSAD